MYIKTNNLHRKTNKNYANIKFYLIKSREMNFTTKFSLLKQIEISLDLYKKTIIYIQKPINISFPYQNQQKSIQIYIKKYNLHRKTNTNDSNSKFYLIKSIEMSSTTKLFPFMASLSCNVSSCHCMRVRVLVFAAQRTQAQPCVLSW